jgi:hypothetical protein
MESNKISSTEDIYVKVDQNNLIYIDPNSTINKDGEISPRNLEQEKLVMYVNLEADIVSRSILSSDNDVNTITSIASGTINFLKNQNGGDYDTSWSDTYTFNSKESGSDIFKSDTSSQSFGIDTINIEIKGINIVPKVDITFIDVRGKTLFESPEDSPYKAFFHVPWPIFYLTVKGFYGKAIRYRLHLVKFTSKFNEGNGNFEISTSFVGATYAYLSDIPLQGILNAPYMFPVESVQVEKTDTKNNKILQTVVKSTRGYSLLKSIYQEYKLKGLIREDFPVKTLREVLTISETLDNILEKEIFDQVVDMRIFAALKEFEQTITDFERAIKSWKNQFLENVTSPQTTATINYFYLNDQEKTNLKNVTGETVNGTLEKLLVDFVNNAERNKIFNQNLLNTTTSNFDKKSIGLSTIGVVGDYLQFDADKKVSISIELLVDRIYLIKNNFFEQRNILEKEVEEKMNIIVRKKDKGFGFEPTIRNIFAVILANAEVLIRLMKDVHQRAFDVDKRRANLVGSLSKETKGSKDLFPWPEIKDNQLKKENVIIYPGDPDYQAKFISNDPQIWPEVEFIENYIGISTNKVDPLSQKEGSVGKIDFNFTSDYDVKKLNVISTAQNVTNTIPYIQKDHTSFLYEMWERALNYTLIDSFNDDTIKEFADLEFKNIQESIQDDNDIRKLLRENIHNEFEFTSELKKIAPFENYSYYLDQIPTTKYIKDLMYGFSFTLEQYTKSTNVDNSSLYEKLKNNLSNYKVESYRKNIFPFNSDTYLKYIGAITFDSSNFNFKDFLNVDTSQGLISGKIEPTLWVKDGGFGRYKNNLFSKPLKVSNNTTLLLNTPYFHNQLNYDFNRNVGSVGKYVGSAYLLLNSLPFVDLDDYITYPVTSTNKTLVSSLFREVSSSQYIPYHLMLKWGSIYHRYKTHINDNIDILSGFLNNSGETIPINVEDFFGNNVDEINGNIVSQINDIGLHPKYDEVFHQIVNGYGHYNTESTVGYPFQENIDNGKIIERKRLEGFNYWTQLVDNSKWDLTDKRYTLLPCDGGNFYINKTGNTLNNGANDNSAEIEGQNYFRIIWEDELINNEYSGKTFFTPYQYNRTVNLNEYKLDVTTNYRKVMDLIATFSPQILDEFEYQFIKFSNQKVESAVVSKPYENVSYYNFQDLLKEIVSIPKESDEDSNVNNLIINIKNKQIKKLEKITKDILSNNNLLKLTLGNPKEIDPHVFAGFSKLDNLNKFSYGSYNSTQLDTNTQKLVDLYIGQTPFTGDTSYYDNRFGNNLDFFSVNDVELSEQNILQFRPLILMYSGWLNQQRKVTPSYTPTKVNFQDYIKTNVFLNPSTDIFGINKLNGSTKRLSLFLTTLIANFKTLKLETTPSRTTFFDGYNNKALKVELYNFFKSMNDKWIAGNSIGQRSLLEEFLFLDKANKDIGDVYYFNLTRLKALSDPLNSKLSLYSVISTMLQDTGFDMRALPAYINFYGTNYSSKPKITPSKNIAKNIFGTFLDVDYQEATPKVIIQYIGKNSIRPDMGEKNKKYKFTDDSFNMSNVNNNPIMYELPRIFKTGDLAKSNKAVAFEVSFGDQNQSIFKGVTLDQTSIKNTSESFYVLENLAKSESGSATSNVDMGLFDYYRQASYTCDVTCMGNVMIQPTMFFYLKNIPMFKGSYWITEVSHMIKNNNITTKFKGSRIPYTSLPDLSDSFMSSYRTLFDKLTNKAQSRVNGVDLETKTSIVFTASDGTNYTYDNGGKLINGETTLFEAGIINGVPYNGFMGSRSIQKVSNSNFPDQTWLRAIVVRMGGVLNPITDTSKMAIINGLTTKSPLLNGTPTPVSEWLFIKTRKEDDYFYSTNFKLDKFSADKLVEITTTFLNPANKKTITVPPSYKLNITTQPFGYYMNGPLDVMPEIGTFGISLSNKLMLDLDLHEGEVVYFNLK